MTNFSDLLDTSNADTFAADPRPGWAGPALLFGAAYRSLPELPKSCNGFLAAGIPFDGTASSRPGAAEGPVAIRQASLIFSSYIDSLGQHEMHDLRTGETFCYQRGDIIDVGDLHVYQTDTIKTFRAVASEVRGIAATGATLLLMGGDHSISFPAFAGWQAGMASTHPGERLGYIQIDHHFDFGNHSTIHGSLYHGSNARRISELPGIAPERMAFIGVGAVTRKAQLEGLLRGGYHVISAREIHQSGTRVALETAIAKFKERCDAVYLSIDIDVLDASVAPGTGNVTIGGLTGGEFFDVVSELMTLPVRALDITEVAPRYDPTGRTAYIAARLLFEFVYRRSADGARVEAGDR